MGGHDGGIIVGIAACGMMIGIVSTVLDLTHDFEDGYMAASACSM
jgi:hypothetical protein